MPEPIAVLISDVHYSLQTLEVADTAMRLAIAKANELRIPLVVAGDLHDTKANLRAECVNRLFTVFDACTIKPWVIVGNHDKINERSEEHALNFLSKKVNLVNRFRYSKSHNTTTIGREWVLACYHHDTEELKRQIANCGRGSKIIMHQGMTGSMSGDYIQDKTALKPEDVAGCRIISGHYHTRQTIALPDGGQWDYIGNPYTLTYAEANDPPKGFQILMDDGSLEFVPTNLRKHVVFEYIHQSNLAQSQFSRTAYHPGDLLWVKAHYVGGTAPTKDAIAKELGISEGFRLDLIPAETTTDKPAKPESMSQQEILDGLIDSLKNTDKETKSRVKALWKNL